MTVNSPYFRDLQRGLAHHRSSLLKGSDGQYFFPPRGTPWIPTRRQQSLCDAFIFFVNAELETYFESLIAEALQFFEDFSLECPLSSVSSHHKMHEFIREKKKNISKNHNVRWEKTQEFWVFIGFDKQLFPENFWDYVEAVSRYRGDVAHQGWGIRVFNDPRTVFAAISNLVPLITWFDRDFVSFRRRQDNLLSELRTHHVSFIPGLGSISPLR